MREWVVVAASAGLGLAGCAEDVETNASPEVELFGAMAISSEAPEFALALSPDGDTAYFNRTPLDRSRLDLFVSVRSGGTWSEAALFGPTAGISAIDPFMSSSGNELYFSSDLETSESPGSFGLWFVQRTAEGWSAPVAVPQPVNSDSSDVFNTFSSDGLMVFSSRRSGPRRIFSTRRSGDAWEVPTPLQLGNVEEASNPAISPDGSFIVIAARAEGRGADLFVTCREGSGWSEPVVLPDPINSTFGELAPLVTDEWLYFTSERPGVVGIQPEGVRPPGDIYRTDVANASVLCLMRAP